MRKICTSLHRNLDLDPSLDANVVRQIYLPMRAAIWSLNQLASELRQFSFARQLALRVRSLLDGVRTAAGVTQAQRQLREFIVGNFSRPQRMALRPFLDEAVVDLLKLKRALANLSDVELVLQSCGVNAAYIPLTHCGECADPEIEASDGA